MDHVRKGNYRMEMRRICTRAMVLAFMLALSASVRAQQLAVKTNLLYAATTTPNLGLELRLSNKWTAGISAGFNPFTFSENKKLKHFLVSPEARYWLCDAFSGHFIGMNAVYSHYNVGNIDFPFGLYSSVKDERRQGDMAAIGASWGYSWILSPRWSVEVEAGADVGYTWYKAYGCAHCASFVGKDNKLFVMPRLGVNIVFNIM